MRDALLIGDFDSFGQLLKKLAESASSQPGSRQRLLISIMLLHERQVLQVASSLVQAEVGSCCSTVLLTGRRRYELL